MTTSHTEEEKHWYALRVYRGVVGPVVAACRRDGMESYRPMMLVEQVTPDGVTYAEKTVVHNLLFVRATGSYVNEMQTVSRNRCSVYCHPGTRVPAAIDDHTMAMFMLVLKAGAHSAEPVDLPMDKGDKVRVTDGIFKGAEGYIRRVHGTRRFVVAIEGVVAVALTCIPRQFLERIAPVVPAATHPQTPLLHF